MVPQWQTRSASRAAASSQPGNMVMAAKVPSAVGGMRFVGRHGVASRGSAPAGAVGGFTSDMQSIGAPAGRILTSRHELGRV